jgi:hypothetical protein
MISTIRVTCLTKEFTELTYGKVYQVQQVSGSSYFIENDNGEDRPYGQAHFEIV